MFDENKFPTNCLTGAVAFDEMFRRRNFPAIQYCPLHNTNGRLQIIFSVSRLSSHSYASDVYLGNNFNQRKTLTFTESKIKREKVSLLHTFMFLIVFHCNCVLRWWIVPPRFSTLRVGDSFYFTYQAHQIKGVCSMRQYVYRTENVYSPFHATPFNTDFLSCCHCMHTSSSGRESSSLGLSSVSIVSFSASAWRCSSVFGGLPHLLRMTLIKTFSGKNTILSG